MPSLPDSRSMLDRCVCGSTAFSDILDVLFVFDDVVLLWCMRVYEASVRRVGVHGGYN
jgi:hypothetical protein